VAGEKIATSIAAGTYILTATPVSFITGVGPKCISVVLNRNPTGVNTQTASVGNATQQLLTLSTTDYKGYNINITDVSLLYASGAAGDTLSWTVFQ